LKLGVPLVRTRLLEVGRWELEVSVVRVRFARSMKLDVPLVRNR